jgi:alkaline phosphatase D
MRPKHCAILCLFILSFTLVLSHFSPLSLPAIASEPSSGITHGPISGEITDTSAVLWARANPLASEITFDVALDESFDRTITTQTVSVDSTSDYTGETTITGLQPNQTYYYRVSGTGDRPRDQTPSFSTAPAPTDAEAFSFVFGACIGGQGYCRDRHNGWQIFDAMAERDPDFFLLVGDGVYVDTNCPSGDNENQDLENVPGQEIIADDLEEMRDRYRYHLEDESYQEFLKKTPVYVTWDDHEAIDNFAGTDPDPERQQIIADGKQAFFEYWPIHNDGSDRIYRKVSYGALADFFILDTRSYRDPIDAIDFPNKTMLGIEQLAWLQQGLQQSQATWKFIVTSVPLGYTTGEFKKPEPATLYRDGWANYPDHYGYEAELNNLIHTIQRNDLQNIVFLTGDTHWPFAIQYDPDNDGVANFHELGSSPLSAIVLAPREAPASTEHEGMEESIFYHTGILDPTFHPNLIYPLNTEGMFGSRRFNFGQISIDRQGNLTFNVWMQQNEAGHAEVYAPVEETGLPLTLRPE